MTEATLVKAPRPVEKTVSITKPETNRQAEKAAIEDLILKLEELRVTGKINESQSGFLYTAQCNLRTCLGTL